MTMQLVSYNPQLLLPAPTKSEVIAETSLQLLFLGHGRLAWYVEGLVKGADKKFPVSARKVGFDEDE